jgi:hypothetical protein
MLQREGIPPERRLHGGKQPTMREPVEHDLARMIRLLNGRLGKTISKRGIVRYRQAAGGTQLIAGAALTFGERQVALDALVVRLTAYYRERVGAERAEQPVRSAFERLS